MPPSPLTIRLSLEAELDFIDILIYTEKTFGFEQKEIYAGWIDAALTRLAEMPTLGTAIEQSSSRRFHISKAGNRGSHYIYYRYDADSLWVVRILHQSRDYLNVPPFS